MQIGWIRLLSLLAVAATGCNTTTLPIQSRSTLPDSPEGRALNFLVKEVPRWSRENHCFSCHNNGDAARALFAASALGYPISKAALTDTIAWLQKPESWDHNQGDPAFSDKCLARIQFTTALASAIDTRQISNDPALVHSAEKLIEQQNADGAWHIEPITALGSPATYGTCLATVMARSALKKINTPTAKDACNTSERWLRRYSARSVLDSAAVLMFLADHKDPEALARRRECLDVIRGSHAHEGGWGPFPDSPPEPFDTAVVILALKGIPNENGIENLIQRGRDFLVQSQFPDGSWPETTRPPRGESYAQRISTSGWATLALLKTAPAK